MKTRSLLTAVVAVSALSVAAGALPAQAATTIKLSTCLQRTNDLIDAFFETFVKPINAMKTDVSIRYLGGTEVTPRQKQAPALKRGIIDMIICPPAYYNGMLSEARLIGLQTKTLKELRANGAWDMMQEAWGKGLNAHILTWGYFTGQKFYVYTTVDPKFSEKTGLDLTGVKVRSTGLYNALFRAMGATTIVISPGDIYSALERGLVKGLAWPWGSVRSYGWQKFLKYRIDHGFYGATMVTLVNKKKWDGLSQAQQAVLNKQARIYEQTSDALLIKRSKIDDEVLRKAGVKFLKLEGKVREAYLNTIYGAKWAENDKVAKEGRVKFIVDYEKLKRLIYSPGS
jgi:TRAP-type C4-dicarboxylate transport system substrate-binding protein